MTKSAGIRTSSGGGGRPGILVPPGGATCVETEGRSSGFDTGSGDGAELHGREGGGEMEEGKEREEGEEEEEEGEEGEEGGKTNLIELLEGKEGAKGDMDIGDDETEETEDDAGFGKSSDEFGSENIVRMMSTTMRRQWRWRHRWSAAFRQNVKTMRFNH
ncbi:hypothetical protein CBR_g38849 [Chara braunii]|uniref:Uncharacterized protein n=1 Tax=Chara braunii TaxID=69332 RepID=A0A388LQH6_CHABU|nr:hypothetical protein CBR_g38849 [Chara braunii]|eukprot:GBG84567.1 hypothetical protein CBR_g38849 [Chara braunii]